jgi:phosphatidylserine/phosphatidylglycerophosphate/cardiolipin synthase-like enzyme
MAALNRRVQSVRAKGNIFDIRVSDDLHAKIYAIPDGTVIVGSANLTWPGMTRNIEVIFELTEEEADSFSSVLTSMGPPYACGFGGFCRLC